MATAVRAKGGTGHGDFESETFMVFDARGNGNGNGNDVNTLTGDHAGRPTDFTPIVFDTTQITSRTNRSNPKPGDPSHPLVAKGDAPLVVGTLQANGKAAGSATQQDAESGMLVTHSLRGEGFDASEDGTGRGTPLVAAEYTLDPDEVSPTLTGGPNSAASKGKKSGQDRELLVPFAFEARVARNGRGAPSDMVPALKAQAGGTGKGDAAPLIGFNARQDPVSREDGTGPVDTDGSTQGVHQPMLGVRRIMPVECERLQDFPDNFTLIPWRGKPASECPDGPRYKAVGNSMARVVMNHLGRRIQIVAARAKKEKTHA